MEEKLKKVILTLLVIVTYFFANDGYGALGAGGIIIGKTDDIAMAKEVLEISYNKIKVDYEFINESDKDITETIVFPLPEFMIGEAPFHDHVSYLKLIDSFKVVVDGKPIAFQTKVRTVANRGEFEGQDITEKLLKLGFSERDIIASEDQYNEIIEPKMKILQENGLSVDINFKDDDYIQWTNYITYEWKQTFKAHQKVKISHEYQPLTGGGASWRYYCHSSMPESQEGRFSRDYCMSKETFKLLDNYCFKYYGSPSAKDYYPENNLWGTDVSYILKTANTWKDGIRDFILIIHKKSDEVVSFCFPTPLKHINPFRDEIHLENFKPEQDLNIYFGNAD